MLCKRIAVFCVCVTGLAIADMRQANGEDFAQTFANVASQASKQLTGTGRVKSLLPYAARLAGKDTQVDVAFLQKIVETDEVAMRAKLALLVLVGKGGKEARDGLYTLLVRKPGVGSEVAFHMSPNDVRDAAERVLVNRKEAKLQIAAARFLALVGDKNSLVLLKKREKASVGADNATVRTMLQIAISAVTRRLSDAPKDRQLQWAMQELRYARAAKEARMCRSEEAGIMRSARSAAGEGAFSIPFLRNKIKTGQMLAVAIAGVQRETHLVDDLAKVPGGTAGARGTILTYALVGIGNAAAMDALAKQMKPGATGVNQRIARTLALDGTESSAVLLKRLSEDKKYRASWPVFGEWLKVLKDRLQAKRRRPESQPDTGPASQPAGEPR